METFRVGGMVMQVVWESWGDKMAMAEQLVRKTQGGLWKCEFLGE